MKSNWKILTLVGALAVCCIQASLAQSPASPASGDDDFYSGSLADDDSVKPEAGGDAPREDGDAQPGEEMTPDPTTYAARLDDGATGDVSPEPDSTYYSASLDSEISDDAEESADWTLPVPDPGDPIERFATLANAMFTSGLDDFGGKGKGCGKGCEQYCGCLCCRRAEVFQRTFASFEYMNLWSRSRNLPPLVTTDDPNTPINSGAPDFTPIALTLNSPTSQILLGDENIGGDRQTAGRLTAGWWLDDCGSRAIGFRYYGSEGETFGRSYASDGSVPLGRPFFNSDPLVAAQDALIVAHPVLNRSGSIGVRGENDFVGAEAFFRTLLDAGHNYRVDLIGGYRFNRIDDSLLITTTIDDPGADIDLLDLFGVSNEYHAGEFGLYGELYHGCWTLSMLGKIGIGNMEQRVAIGGVNVVNSSSVTPGGLLAQPTNIGLYKRNMLVWSPEANIKLSYAVTDRLSVTLGYTFMYWTQVAMAGDQIDFNVNSTQLNGGTLIGPPNPRFRFNDSDYWTQSADIGLSWNY